MGKIFCEMLLNSSCCCMKTWCMVGFGQKSYLATTMGLSVLVKSFLSKHVLLWAESRNDVDLGTVHAWILYTQW